ncbi:UvrD-helicase domain-containing protein [Bacillus dakarensis]|uniref:UvrD-helicase domain-containing protein n=1 Tax=Robertmurraya dakarensis TaxID=1926278 RepID=UPI000981BA23|nr:UvrD-helicase domain-containing protein [Bacillus dakarensis]
MIRDQRERERIQQELDTNFLVEAGAGSGKTTSMVQRMLSLIKKKKATVDKIAAITFTNKAASELKERFVIALEKAVRDGVDAEEVEVLKAAYENVNQCFIGTIHSFCGTLLRERPLEAGLDPAFTEMDEEQAKEVQDQCWDEYLSKLMDTGQTDELKELTSYGVDSEALRDVYHRMMQNTDVDVFTKEVEYPNFEPIRESILPLIEEAKVYFPSTKPEQGWDGFQQTILDTLQLLKIKDLNDDLTVLQIAESINKSLDITQNRWTDKDVAKAFKNEKLPEWKEEIVVPILRAWREFLHPKIVHFVLPIIEYCQQRKQERGLVDFQDLLLKTTALLREHQDVRTYFKQRYTHLLVDEFQDTDPVQAEMMLLLTGKDREENDWRKLVPNKGSLFIVGDPKQSIYRFRRADISTYHFVKKKIEENGEVLKLTTNFRSVDSIGTFVDRIFQSKFLSDEHETQEQAAFAPMNTVQPNPDSLYGVYTITHPKVTRHNPREICEMDAVKIASFIAWSCQGNLTIQVKDHDGKLISREAEPGDFLILLKQRKHLHIYAEKLAEYGILSDITGSETRYEELLALVQLVKCVNNPQDSISLLAVLRGMFFGCSDEDLYQYKRAANFFSIKSLPKKDSLPENAKNVFDALAKLQQYHSWVRRMPALSAFMKIFEDIGVLPYALMQSSGLIVAGTLLQMIEGVLADHFASANWNDLTELLNDLLEKEEAKGMEGTGLFLGSPQAVRIMNLHKAKGLEASVVFLAEPVGEKEHPPKEHIDRSGEDPIGYFTIEKKAAKGAMVPIAEPYGWCEKADIEKRYMEAEKDRLLYVAATRPKQLLVVSRYPAKSSLSPWEDLSRDLPSEQELSWIETLPADKEIVNETPDLTSLLKRWSLWRELSEQPSFVKHNVTNLVKGESSSALPRSVEGKGPVFGTVVHRCMEEIGKGRDQGDLTQLIAFLAEEEGLEAQHHEEALRSVQSILKSEIWQRGQKAIERYHEFSFQIQKENRQIQGVIDFLFLEDDGWVIVDFKTDAFVEVNLTSYVDHYRPQVQYYGKEWEETFQGKVKEQGLYFTSIQKYVEV